jgi:hypothetical protein
MNRDKKIIFILLKKSLLAEEKIFIKVIDFLMLKKQHNKEQMNMF